MIKFIILIFFVHLSVFSSESIEDYMSCLDKNFNIKDMEKVSNLVPVDFLSCNIDLIGKQKDFKYKKSLSKITNKGYGGKRSLETNICDCYPKTKFEEFFYKNFEADIKNEEKAMTDYGRKLYKAKFKNIMKDVMDLDVLLKYSNIQSSALSNVKYCNLSKIKESLSNRIGSECGISNAANIIEEEILGSDYSESMNKFISNMVSSKSCIPPKAKKRLQFRGDIRLLESISDIKSEGNDLISYSIDKILNKEEFNNKIDLKLKRMSNSLIGRLSMSDPAIYSLIDSIREETINKNRGNGEGFLNKFSQYSQELPDEIINKISNDKMMQEMIFKSVDKSCENLVKPEVIKMAFCPFIDPKKDQLDVLKSAGGELSRHARAKYICNKAPQEKIIEDDEFSDATSDDTQKEVAEFLSPVKNLYYLDERNDKSKGEIDKLEMSLCQDIKCEKNGDNFSCDGGFSKIKENGRRKIAEIFLSLYDVKECLNSKDEKELNSEACKAISEANRKLNDNIDFIQNKEMSDIILTLESVLARGGTLDENMEPKVAELSEVYNAMYELESIEEGNTELAISKTIGSISSDTNTGASATKKEELVSNLFSTESGKSEKDSLFTDYFSKGTSEDFEKLSSPAVLGDSYTYQRKTISNNEAKSPFVANKIPSGSESLTPSNQQASDSESLTPEISTNNNEVENTKISPAPKEKSSPSVVNSSLPSPEISSSIHTSEEKIIREIETRSSSEQPSRKVTSSTDNSEVKKLESSIDEIKKLQNQLEREEMDKISSSSNSNSQIDDARRRIEDLSRQTNEVATRAMAKADEVTRARTSNNMASNNTGWNPARASNISTAEDRNQSVAPSSLSNLDNQAQKIADDIKSGAKGEKESGDIGEAGAGAGGGRSPASLGGASAEGGALGGGSIGGGGSGGKNATGSFIDKLKMDETQFKKVIEESMIKNASNKEDILKALGVIGKKLVTIDEKKVNDHIEYTIREYDLVLTDNLKNFFEVENLSTMANREKVNAKFIETAKDEEKNYEILSEIFENYVVVESKTIIDKAKGLAYKGSIISRSDLTKSISEFYGIKI